MAVARQCELGLELGFVQLLFDLELEGVARQKTGWCQAIQRGGCRDDHHVGACFLVTLTDAPQRGQALADQVLMRRKRVVGQGFPVREQGAAQFRRKKSHLFDQPLGIGGVRGDDGHQPVPGFLPLTQLRQQQGIRRAHRTGQGEAFAVD